MHNMLVIRWTGGVNIRRGFYRSTMRLPLRDQSALGVVGLWMVRGIIAEPRIKRERPAHADQGEDGKRPSPADPINEPLRDRIRGRAAEQHRRGDNSLGAPRDE